jgi:hypothetical protein
MQIDLHGYHPAEIVWSGVLAKLVEQAWEMGERELILIHGHGRNRGITPGFVNTNTGFFGLQIRSALRHDKICAAGFTTQHLTAATRVLPVCP